MNVPLAPPFLVLVVEPLRRLVRQVRCSTFRLLGQALSDRSEPHNLKVEQRTRIAKTVADCPLVTAVGVSLHERLSSSSKVRKTTLFALTLALLLTAHPAHTQTRLNLTAAAGVGDNVRIGAQTPIQITLANDGPQDFQGRVTAAFLARSTVAVSASRDLELAPGATKRVTLYLPAMDGITHVRVTYETFRGPLGWRPVRRIEQQLNTLDAETPIFAGVNTAPRGLPPERDERNTRIYYRFYVQPDQLPDRVEGLDMFDVLFLSPPGVQSYTSPQIRALGEWVLRGGLLVVDASSPSEAFREGRIGDLMPFIPQNNEQGMLPIFDRDVLYATGQRLGGETLLESAGVPLVVRRNLGIGSVVTFAIAPDDPALQNWPNQQALWNKILGSLVTPYPKQFLGAGSGGFYGQRHATTANALANSVTQAPSTGMRLGLVLLMTGLYALVAGPGDYLLVRRLKKPRLTWITFPLIVVFFTVAAYLGARYWIGGDWEQRTAERTIVFPESAAALRFDVAGVFVPQGAEYTIASERTGMLRHIGEMYGLDDPVRIDGDTGSITQSIPIWTHRAYVSSETLTGYDDIDAQWTWGTDTIQIDVTNNSDRTLSPQYAMAGEDVWSLRSRFDAIPPGQSVQLEFGRKEAVRTEPDPGAPPAPPGRPDEPLAWETYSAPDFIFLGLAAGPPGRSPFARELNLRGALERGAQVVTFEAAGNESPLTVDAEPIPTTHAESLIQVLTYSSQAKN